LLHILYHIGIIIAVKGAEYVQTYAQSKRQEDDQEHQEEEAEQAQERDSDSNEQEEEQEVIRLEPKEIYDAAVIGQDGDRLVYCYDLLLDAITDQTQEDLHICRDRAEMIAQDHIAYNIKGSASNFADWPIIKNRDENEQSKEE